SQAASTVKAMPPPPRVTGREVVKALRRLGWVVVVQKGSHVQLKHPSGGGRVTVPIHAGERWAPGCSGRSWLRLASRATSFGTRCERMTGVRTYTIVVEPDKTGDLVVSVPALPGCFTRGRTIEESRERAIEAIEVHIAGLIADGESVPEEFGSPQLFSVT